METMTRVGVKLVNDKKKAVLSDGVLDPDQISGKDVLSTLSESSAVSRSYETALTPFHYPCSSSQHG